MVSTKRLCRQVAFVGLGLSLPGLAFGEPLLYMVPQGENPDNFRDSAPAIEIRPWESITLDLIVTLSEPTVLSAIVMTVDHASGGQTGTVNLTNISINTNSSAYLPQFHGAADVLELPPTKFSNVSFDPPLLEANRNYYVGEITYEPFYFPGLWACGTFTVAFIDPGVDELSGTRILDGSFSEIPFSVQGANILISRAGGYGDVNLDEEVDIQDIFCVLDGFQASFENCTFEDLDIAHCESDGIIDIGDIFAVLDAFQGIQPCVPWCGPPGME